MQMIISTTTSGFGDLDPLPSKGNESKHNWDYTISNQKAFAQWGEKR